LDASRRIGSRLLRAEEICVIPRDWKLGLRGAHQGDNAALALAAWRELASRHDWPERDDLVRAGLEKAFIAGRLQSIPASRGLPDLLLDGAHNTHAFAVLREALRELGIRPCAVIFSCLADKDLAGMAPLVLDVAGGAPLCIPPLSVRQRSAAPGRIAAALGATACVAPSLEAALEAAGRWSAAPRSPVLMCGSLYLLADFFRLYPEYMRG
jgi:dihydrofolate synthase/folylpolyglutamate synthase